jgi:DNA polymerase III sliding clamp (beta) subunit (PCNA family)
MRVAKAQKTGTLLVSVGAGRAKATSQHEGTVEAQYVRFDLAPWSLVVRCSDGRFPPWEKVVPQQGGETYIIRLDPTKFGGAVKRVRKVYPHGSMRMLMLPDEGTVRVSAENPDAAGVEIDVATTFDVSDHDMLSPRGREQLVDGQFVAGFNPEYMLDAVKGMGDEVTMRFHDSIDGVRVESESGRLVVTMPMKL